MSDAIGFLLWLVFVGISAIIIGYFLKYYGLNDKVIKEGFTTVYACPANTTNYVTEFGETNCCNGDVVDGVCTGNDVCTLSPNSRLGLSSCSGVAAQTAAAQRIQAAANCPTGIPNYFSSPTGLSGCSVSAITNDGTAPTDQNALQCIFYATSALDSSKLDSCFNYVKNQDADTARIQAIAAADARCLAVPNPTGYLMYGGDIGEPIKPVERMLIRPSTPSITEGKIYLAKLTDRKMGVVITNSGTTTITQSFSITGTPQEITSIVDYDTYLVVSNMAVNTNKPEKRYAIKSVDNSRVLPPLS